MDISSITSQYTKLSDAWEGSIQKHGLVTTIRRKLLNIPNLHVDSAMCLGLGSMEQAPSYRAASQEYTDDINRLPEVPDSWESDVSDDEPSSLEETPHDRLTKTTINPLLYQLIIFETTIQILREKFTINHVYFQDPWFTKADIAFLESRGHEVIPYPFTPYEKQDTPVDMVMLEHVTNSTFVFAPALDIPIFAEVVCTKEPGLLLGQNAIEKLGFPVLRGDLLEKFEEIICPCDFADLRELGMGSFGFTWRLILEGERALSKFQRRLVKAEELKRERLSFIKRKDGDST